MENFVQEKLDVYCKEICDTLDDKDRILFVSLLLRKLQPFTKVSKQKISDYMFFAMN